MTRLEALGIVLDLARDNLAPDDDEHRGQKEDQLLALDILGDLADEWAAPKRKARNTWRPKVKLTYEQMQKFAPMLVATWQAIGPDCERLLPKRGRVAHIVELVCDANRPMDFGGMGKEEYEDLTHAYHRKDTQKWLREVLNY